MVWWAYCPKSADPTKDNSRPQRFRSSLPNSWPAIHPFALWIWPQPFRSALPYHQEGSGRTVGDPDTIRSN